MSYPSRSMHATMASVHREMAIALELAIEAGKEILGLYGSSLRVEQKGEEGPVTEADRRADALIREGLSHAFPSDAILSEEFPDDQSRLHERRLWLVDPLDGTQSFIDRIDEFAVMIGLALEGRGVLGVVHLPCEEITLVAAEGVDAFRVTTSGRREPLSLSPWTAEEDALRVVVSRQHAGSATRHVLEELHPSSVIRSGSVGRKAALVAIGRADLYLSLGRRSRHWDACAPEVVVRLAGGTFQDARGGAMVYNTPDTRNRHGLLAARRGLEKLAVKEILAAVDQPGKDSRT